MHVVDRQGWLGNLANDECVHQAQNVMLLGGEKQKVGVAAVYRDHSAAMDGFETSMALG